MWRHVPNARRLHVHFTGEGCGETKCPHRGLHIHFTGEGCGDACVSTKCPHRVLSAHRSQSIFSETIQTREIHWIHHAFLFEGKRPYPESQRHQESFRKVSWKHVTHVSPMEGGVGAHCAPTKVSCLNRWIQKANTTPTSLGHS